MTKRPWYKDMDRAMDEHPEWFPEGVPWDGFGKAPKCEGYHYYFAGKRICQTWGSNCPDLKSKND